MIILWTLLIAFATSALCGTLGMASGVFIVPVLTMTGLVDIHTAIGASLISVFACSCASAPQFLKAGLVNIRLAAVLEIGSTAGALTGVFLAGFLEPSVLYLLFAAVMFVSAHQMFSNRRTQLLQSEPIVQPTW